MYNTNALFLLLSASLLVFADNAPAQTRLPPETPEAIRRDMSTIDKYYAEVEKRSGGKAARPTAARGETQEGEQEARGKESGRGNSLGELFTPLVVAPPRTSITPDAPERAIDATIRDRDPFEVSPRLREGNSRNNRPNMQEGMALNQLLRLRAVVRGPEGGIAKIQSGNNTLVVRDGDEIDVNGIRYTVYVEADGLMLRGAGAPQYKMLVR
ncbi:MAG: hypothetical protein LBF50_08005 [Azoarcus sp.]|jgi:hypothetical protein|nr:hypothetical protein [Azoarcus sp.]